jgi:hypothetical protein
MSRHPKGLSRRHVLRGIMGGSAVSLALPWLEAMTIGTRAAYAGDSGFPTRFLLYFWGNGNLPEIWSPESTGEDFELTSQLSGLASIQHKICLVTGMSIKVPNVSPHSSGYSGLLCGQALEVDGDDATLPGPSIDQVIASYIGGETLYSSIQVGCNDSVDGLSYNGPNSRNPPENDPYALYARLFGDTFREPGEEGLVDPTLGLRRSVLDSVMGDIDDLNGRISSADKERLEQHLDGVRELETRLARLEEDPPNLESCGRPTEPTEDYSDIDGRPQLSARNAIMSEMVAMALACDQTRVVGHYFTDPLTNKLFPDATAGHHDLTHNEGGDQPEIEMITTHCVDNLAVLLHALDSIPEGSGTLLDHTTVMACSEVSKGQTHSLDDVPIILAGGGDGFFRTGYHHRSYTQDNSTKVLLTALQSMGIAVGEFGTDDAWTDQVLSEILL